MNRIYILMKEKQSLLNKLNDYKSLLRTKSRNEIIRLNKEMQQINEKIESINFIIENL